MSIFHSVQMFRTCHHLLDRASIDLFLTLSIAKGEPSKGSAMTSNIQTDKVVLWAPCKQSTFKLHTYESPDSMSFQYCKPGFVHWTHWARETCVCLKIQIEASSLSLDAAAACNLLGNGSILRRYAHVNSCCLVTLGA